MGLGECWGIVGREVRGGRNVEGGGTGMGNVGEGDEGRERGRGRGYLLQRNM